MAAAAWRRSPAEVLVVALAAALMTRRLGVGVIVAGIALLVVVRSVSAHDGLAPDRLDRYVGWAVVAASPDASFGATRVLLDLDGERFESWIRGRATRQRVDGWHKGDVVWVEGARDALDPERAGRVAWQHVVGVFEADVLGDRVAGRRVDVASNRVRELITSATSALGGEVGALARGLIIGDDADQPEAMIDRFRQSGLSHLTAVSGQNVALALALAAPLLHRARPLLRLVATVGVIGWFVVLTHAEPSVLRAGTMAALAALAFTIGGEREPSRLLAAAVVILLVVDPLLVRSIGFWLSVGATAGVTMVGPPLRRRLAGLGPLATPLAMTLGAQAGVLLPSFLAFGRVPLIGVVANLAAVPVAGWVMLYGLPASLAAGALPALRGPIMVPVGLGVRWVDAVAAAGSTLERSPPWNVVVSMSVLAIAVAVCHRWGRREELPQSTR